METFEINGKVAVITGAAAGIGFCTAKELLRNGLKGITLADINKVAGQRALKHLTTEFGDERVIFVETDTTDKKQFEEAFKLTIRAFGNVDILINCAAVLDDVEWEKQIDINIKGTVNGTLLGFEHYLKEYKSGTEGLIINISSTVALHPEEVFPVYTATKYAVLGLSKCYGHECHYKRTNVKVITVCPGGTITNFDQQAHERVLSKQYIEMVKGKRRLPKQTSEHVGESMIAIIRKGTSGSVWVVEHSNPPYEAVMPSKY